MSDPETARRIEDLEVKVAFQEHTIAELDEVIRGLRDDLDRAFLELKQLRDQVADQAEEIVDEKPPHY
jgi:uncharacterized coiled-coil protein SlyX